MDSDKGKQKQGIRVPESMGGLKRTKIELTDPMFQLQGVQYAERLAREHLGCPVTFVDNIEHTYYFVEKTPLGDRYIKWYYEDLYKRLGAEEGDKTLFDK